MLKSTALLSLPERSRTTSLCPSTPLRVTHNADELRKMCVIWIPFREWFSGLFVTQGADPGLIYAALSGQHASPKGGTEISPGAAQRHPG